MIPPARGKGPKAKAEKDISPRELIVFWLILLTAIAFPFAVAEFEPATPHYGRLAP